MIRELTFFSVVTSLLLITNILLLISFEFYVPVELNLYCKIYAESMVFRSYIHVILGLCLLEIGQMKICSFLSIIISVIILSMSLILNLKPPRTILSWNDELQQKFYVNTEYREIFVNNYTSENIQGKTKGTTNILQTTGSISNTYQKV